MVTGLDIFRKFFKGHEANYIIIGGVACHEQLDEDGLSFRATKDIDMILVVEALNTEFVSKFWEFITKGKYNQKQQEEKQRNFYRFSHPETKDFPFQIELFSRKPDVITLKEGMHLTPVPAEDELSSLSAILMDEEYYEFTLENSELVKGLRMASKPALICLKAKAFVNFYQRENDGETVSSKDINKHKYDVFRIAVTLTGEEAIDLPDGIKKDFLNYEEIVRGIQPDLKPVLKDMGVRNPDLNELITVIKKSFKLN